MKYLVTIFLHCSPTTINLAGSLMNLLVNFISSLLTKYLVMDTFDEKYFFTNVLVQCALYCLKMRLNEIHCSQSEIYQLIQPTGIYFLQNILIFYSIFFFCICYYVFFCSPFSFILNIVYMVFLFRLSTLFFFILHRLCRWLFHINEF